MSSSSSSSSSGDRGTAMLAVRVEGVRESPVWCFASRTDANNVRTIYAGTGPSGIVLSSTDLRNWSTFMTVDDVHVTSAAVWANGLFVGTQPHGKIFVHNFTSGEEYLFVETDDNVVTAFAEHNGILYAGTAPAGIVYAFDGTSWRESHRPYGNGVRGMVSTSEGLIVFSGGAESPVVLANGVWKMYPTSDVSGQYPTTASARVALRGIYGVAGQSKIIPSQLVSADLGTPEVDMIAARPTSPQIHVTSATGIGNAAALGGSSNGVVWGTGGNALTKLTDVGEPVDAMVALGDGSMMVASAGTLFLVTK